MTTVPAGQPGRLARWQAWLIPPDVGTLDESWL